MGTEKTIVNRPAFSELTVDSIEPTLDRLLDECRLAVTQALTISPPDWQHLIQLIDEAHNRLNLFWSPVSHLNAVKASDDLRETHKRCLEKLSRYYTELGQNHDLYNATLALRSSDSFTSLGPAEQKLIKHNLLNFELSGVSLQDKDKQRFAEIQIHLSTQCSEFSDHVLDAGKAWTKHIADVSDLEGLPESSIAAARERAESKEVDGFLLNLEYPTYISVMTFAHDAKLREEMYTAYVTRASDLGPHGGQFDNTDLINSILRLRAEKARLLGYQNYAELSMVRKMVESPENVLEFLNDLASRAAPRARREMQELGDFARESLGLKELQAWDIAYVSEKLKKARFDVSDELLKPYFPANRVIPGMFAVIGRLFNLEIEQIPEPDVYHPDVRLYQIKDSGGRVRGEFYLDNYARENKRGGAWMDECATRMRIGDAVQRPIAYLTCNLTPPVGGEPALLTHSEVITLFHEFGHGLHHMLTTVDVAGVSGINGVEWDAVELPSQFLENWCWEREALDMMSGHYQTGEPLPDELLDKIKQARHFQAAMQMVRQLEFALFDMQVHLQSTPEQACDVQKVLDRVRETVTVVPVPSFNRFQHGFTHIFAGGYAAGYFSYKWAEVLSADAYSRFEEEGLFSEQASEAFLSNVLEVGGSRDAMTSFREFRGREPRIDALLRHTGLAA